MVDRFGRRLQVEPGQHQSDSRRVRSATHRANTPTGVYKPISAIRASHGWLQRQMYADKRNRHNWSIFSGTAPQIMAPHRQDWSPLSKEERM